MDLLKLHSPAKAVDGLDLHALLGFLGGRVMNVAVEAEQLAVLWATVDSVRHDQEDKRDGYASCQFMIHGDGLGFASRGRETDLRHLVEGKTQGV